MNKPNPKCPYCHGRGTRVVLITDVDKSMHKNVMYNCKCVKMDNSNVLLHNATNTQATHS